MKEENQTKLMEAYQSLVGDYPIDSVSATLLKEELEQVMDCDISDADFHHIINENAKVYKVYLFRYKKDHLGFVQLGDRRVGEISIEADLERPLESPREPQRKNSYLDTLHNKGNIMACTPA